MSLKLNPYVLGAMMMTMAMPVIAGKMETYAIQAEDDGLGTFKVETGKFGQILKSNRATIFISSYCDAFSPELGKGTWVQDNGGIRILFPDNEVWFRGYETDFDNDCGFFGLTSSLEDSE